MNRPRRFLPLPIEGHFWSSILEAGRGSDNLIHTSCDRHPYLPAVLSHRRSKARPMTVTQQNPHLSIVAAVADPRQERLLRDTSRFERLPHDVPNTGIDQKLSGFASKPIKKIAGVCRPLCGCGCDLYLLFLSDLLDDRVQPSGAAAVVSGHVARVLAARPVFLQIVITTHQLYGKFLQQRPNGDGNDCHCHHSFGLHCIRCDATTFPRQDDIGCVYVVCLYVPAADAGHPDVNLVPDGRPLGQPVGSADCPPRNLASAGRLASVGLLQVDAI